MGRYRPPPPASSSYITPEGAAKLRQELEYLWKTKRPAITRAVAEAAAQGDRSENAEYIYGKKQLAEIDRRVRYLNKRFDELKIVTQTPADAERVYFGADIVLTDEDGTRVRYRLVGPDEIGLEQGNLSMDSPTGKAVLGKRIGEEISVCAPAGTRHYVVSEIGYRGKKNARQSRASHRGNSTNAANADETS